jgi:molybdopterin-containing oxidoreductase family iron-sulfur binding subunit
MVIDLDRCTGCEACVTACQAENNIKLNPEDHYVQQRAILWMRVERYWEGEYPNVKAVFAPILCQHCANAPCEPVCPVFAPYHNPEGLNTQIYNRCIGTRLCAVNCPYHIRFFNFWPPNPAPGFENAPDLWPQNMPDSLRNQLNPDVTVRSQGIMEKCTYCIQRINRAERQATSQNRPLRDGEVQPACAQTCPSDALVFGDLKDPNSRVSRLYADAQRNPQRAFKLLDHLGTDPAVLYMKRIEV